MAQYEITFAGGGQPVTIETAETLATLARVLSEGGFVIGKHVQSLGRNSTRTREIAVLKGQVLTMTKIRD